jgi:N-acetylglutamate synthase-like GNAT family acetyltransferase
MGQSIQIREFDEEDLSAVYKLIQDTIDISYHKVYSKEAIEFFKGHHSRKHILDDAVNGYTIIAEHESEILGTATLFGSNIRRVFVSPRYQHSGIGKLLVQDLEKNASFKRLTIVDLEASLNSKMFWDSLGFTVREEDFVPVRNKRKLRYYKMFKPLK